MRVIVDFEMCDSNGFCVDAAPEVFELGDDDVLSVLDDHPAEALRERVLRAVGSCPKNAISLEE
jgi:ferredoxin